MWFKNLSLLRFTEAFTLPIEQLEENLRVASEAVPDMLSNDELKMYDSIRDVMAAKVKADCTACRYCMPCSSGVEIPEVLSALNNAAKWDDSNHWLTGYSQVTGKAGKCTACRDCEEICPQGLPISSLMKESLALFRE